MIMEDILFIETHRKLTVVHHHSYLYYSDTMCWIYYCVKSCVSPQLSIIKRYNVLDLLLCEKLHITVAIYNTAIQCVGSTPV